MKNRFVSVLARLRAFFSLKADTQDWDRVSLCSMAPLSADALRHNQEAERSQGHSLS